MAFGFSPSDIFTLLNLKKKAYDGWRSAGAEYADVSQTLSSFTVLLGHIQHRFDDPETARSLHWRKDEVETSLHGCRSAVLELEANSDRYRKLRHLDRLKLGFKDVSKPKDRLVRHMSILTPFVMMVEMEPIGKDVRHLPDTIVQISTIVQSAVTVAFGNMMDSRAQSARSARSSVLTTYGEDDKLAYRELRRGMRDLGIKDSDIRTHRAELVEFIRSALSDNRLEDDPLAAESPHLATARFDRGTSPMSDRHEMTYNLRKESLHSSFHERKSERSASGIMAQGLWQPFVESDEESECSVLGEKNESNGKFLLQDLNQTRGAQPLIFSREPTTSNYNRYSYHGTRDADSVVCVLGRGFRGFKQPKAMYSHRARPDSSDLELDNCARLRNISPSPSWSEDAPWTDCSDYMGPRVYENAKSHLPCIDYPHHPPSCQQSFKPRQHSASVSSPLLQLEYKRLTIEEEHNLTVQVSLPAGWSINTSNGIAHFLDNHVPPRSRLLPPSPSRKDYSNVAPFSLCKLGFPSASSRLELHECTPSNSCAEQVFHWTATLQRHNPDSLGRLRNWAGELDPSFPKLLQAMHEPHSPNRSGSSSEFSSDEDSWSREGKLATQDILSDLDKDEPVINPCCAPSFEQSKPELYRYRDCEISLYCRSQGYDDDQPQLGLEESQSLNKYHGSGVGTALLVTVETPRSRLLEDKLNDTIIDSIPRRKFDGHSGLTPSRKLELLPSK